MAKRETKARIKDRASAGTPSDDKLDRWFEMATDNAVAVFETIRSGGDVAGLMNRIFDMPAVTVMWRREDGRIDYRLVKGAQLMQDALAAKRPLTTPMTHYRAASVEEAEAICGSYRAEPNARWVEVRIGDELHGATLTASRREP